MRTALSLFPKRYCRVAKPIHFALVTKKSSTTIAQKLPRSQTKTRVERLGTWSCKLRDQDPLQVLKRSMKGRVRTLMSLKEERMAASPFGFFRGAAPVMAYDLSLGTNSFIPSQLCGDAHVQNLGAYEGLDGRLTFDINDFDETIRGPFEWDLKRMTTSILLAGEQARVHPEHCEAAAMAFLELYTTLIKTLASLPVLEMARYQVHRLASSEPISKILQKAERTTPLHSRDQLTEGKGAKRVFRSEPPLLRRVQGAERNEVMGSLKRYRKSLLPERQHFFDQFRVIDVAFKVVGTGSVGLRDYCIYMEGNGEDDPLFLQVKEESASAYAAYLPSKAVAAKHEGQRVAEGQRATQLQSDPLLGWTDFGGRNYLVRQLNDHKASLDVTTLDETGLAEYSSVCGEMLARGHARSGNAGEIHEFVGEGKHFSKAMLAFATAYAVQTVEDWKALLVSRKG